jgi:hypothetical protein
MAAGNGFLTVTPDSRYGDKTGIYTENLAGAARFQCPATGAAKKNIKEIGLYASKTAGSKWIMGVFDHDSSNNCPSSLVLNSGSGEIFPTTDMQKSYYTYSGTLPEVDAGSYYWLGVIVTGANMTPSRFENAAGVALYISSGLTYPTWPTDTEWHTHTDQTHSYSFYVVYEDASSGLPISVAQYNYRKRRS